jgi:hypothetical protein
MLEPFINGVLAGLGALLVLWVAAVLFGKG